jgi:hypothetical protein
MNNWIKKKVAYVGAAFFAAHLTHLKAEPHTHQEHEHGPPIHARVARQTANYLTTDLQLVRFDASFEVAEKIPLDWYLTHASGDEKKG